MNEASANNANASPARDRSFAGASRIIRRCHMYLALFLAPWMIMYALSTMIMNHRESVMAFYPTKTPAYTRERELDYSRSFPADTSPQQMGERILSDIGLEGTHRVTGGREGKPLVIERLHPLALRKITFEPAAGKVIIQREEVRGAAFLERLHRRRGYQNPYPLEDTWAFSVDLAIVAMIFWVLSGLWMWWELRSTWLWGIISGGLGLLLFAVFLFTLGR